MTSFFQISKTLILGLFVSPNKKNSWFFHNLQQILLGIMISQESPHNPKWIFLGSSPDKNSWFLHNPKQILLQIINSHESPNDPKQILWGTLAPTNLLITQNNFFWGSSTSTNLFTTQNWFLRRSSLAQDLWHTHETSLLLKPKPLPPKPISLLEIWHFATVLCNWFSVACDTCN